MIETIHDSRPGDLPTAHREHATEDPYRPHFHFSRPGSRITAPSALVHLPDGYHLFHQDGDRWGHAISRDLVRWRHLPPAEGTPRARLGSVLADVHGGLVAFFTVADPTDPRRGRTVRTALSADSGLSWRTETGPAVPAPVPGIGLRDPRVVRDDVHDRWVMLIASDDRIGFLVSTDLVHWTPSAPDGRAVLGGVGWREGGPLGPDLFPLRLDGSGPLRWVLSWSTGAAPRTNGSASRYLVGDWDGRVFTPRTPPAPVLRADLGRDQFAAISFGDPDSGRRITIGAMDNEDYAGQGPTPDWPGALCTPRELGLVRTACGPRLTERPIAEVGSLHTAARTAADRPITATSNPLSGIGGRAVDMEIELEASAYDTCGEVTLQVRCGGDRHTDIVWRPCEGTLTVDRSESGATEFSEWFTAPHEGTGISAEGLVRADSAAVTARWPQSNLGVMRRVWLRVLVDSSSVEVFSPDGLRTITSAIFPGPGASGLRLSATCGTARLVRATVHTMESAIR